MPVEKRRLRNAVLPCARACGGRWKHVDGGKMYGEVQEAKQKPHVDFKGCLFVYIYIWNRGVNNWNLFICPSAETLTSRACAQPTIFVSIAFDLYTNRADHRPEQSFFVYFFLVFLCAFCRAAVCCNSDHNFSIFIIQMRRGRKKNE